MHGSGCPSCFRGLSDVYVEQIAMFVSGVKVVATRKIEYLYSGGEEQKEKEKERERTSVKEMAKYS